MCPVISCLGLSHTIFCWCNVPQRDEPPTQCVEPMSDRQRVQQTAKPFALCCALRRLCQLAPHSGHHQRQVAPLPAHSGGAMVAAVQLLGSVAATRPPRSTAHAGVSRVQVVNIELSVVQCGQLHAIIEPYYVIIPAKTPGRPKIPWASEVGREIRNKNPAR